MSDPQALHAELLGELTGSAYYTPPLEEALRAVLELHKPVATDFWSAAGNQLGWQCEECASRCHSGSGLSCELPIDAEFPCGTIKVISSALGVTTDG